MVNRQNVYEWIVKVSYRWRLNRPIVQRINPIELLGLGDLYVLE